MITTTNGKKFTDDQLWQLANLIFQRFGQDLGAASAAWGRLFYLDCTEADFKDLLRQGTSSSLRPGTRVQLHPGLDLWMQGARFGNVKSTYPDKGYAIVKVDGVKKQQAIPFHYLSLDLFL